MRVAGHRQPFGNDANDSEPLTVQQDSVSDDVGSAAELVAPELIPEYDHGVSPGNRILARLQSSAEDDRRAEDVEKVSADALPENHPWRYRRRLGKRRRHRAVRGQTRKTGGPVAHIQIVAVRRAQRAAEPLHGIRGADHVQLPGPRHRKGPQQHGVCEAEDRGGHANADADRHDGRCGEPTIAVQHPQAVADVTNDIVEPDGGANIADPFLDLPDAAHSEQRRAPCLGGGAALSNPLCRRHVDEALQVIVELTFCAAGMDPALQRRKQPVPGDHAPSNTLLTATAVRSQRWRCCSSCLRPAGVRR